MKSIEKIGYIKYVLQQLIAVVKDFLTNGLFIFILVITLVVTLNHLGVVHYLLDYLGRDHITQINEAYLHQVKFQISESLMILSSLDASLEVIKNSSSEAFLIDGVQVQVSNIFHTLQQYIEKAISVSSTAAASTIAIELLLDIANKTAIMILTVTISVIASYFLLRNFLPSVSIVMKKFSYALSILSFIAFIGIPLAVYATSVMSKALTEPMAKKAHQHFTEIYQQFVNGKDNNIQEHVISVLKKYQFSSHEVHQQSRSLSISVVRHLIAFLFSAFIFPFCFMYIILKVSRAALKPLFSVKLHTV